MTCHRFPRIENSFGHRRELSLSCACPEVVELISSFEGKIELVSENNIYSINDFSFKSEAFEVKLRKVLIDLCQNDNFLLEERFIAGFEMLLNILGLEGESENNKLNELGKYRKADYVKNLIHKYRNIDINFDETIEELNNLFLDIVMNYKNVHGLENILKEISDIAENTNIKGISAQWNTYKSLINQYSLVLENCIAAKIYSTCTSSEIEDMTISFEIIILEFLLMRYAVFLKYCINKEFDMENIKNFITAFSRIIGNNSGAVIEYFSDQFGEDILAIDYLSLITLV